jgi:hypothetical protein
MKTLIANCGGRDVPRGKPPIAGYVLGRASIITGIRLLSQLKGLSQEFWMIRRVSFRQAVPVVIAAGAEDGTPARPHPLVLRSGPVDGAIQVPIVDDRRAADSESFDARATAAGPSPALRSLKAGTYTYRAVISPTRALGVLAGTSPSDSVKVR